MKRFLSRTPLWGALLLGLTGLIACGQPQTPSTHNGTPTVDLLTATQNTAKSVQAIDVEKGQHVSRDELKAYWKTSNPLTAASINDISTSLVYVRDLTGQFAVVSYNTTNGVEQELFRTNSRIQSAGATGDGRFLAISALNPANGQYDIYRVHLISGTVERITSNTLDDLNVSITADGETIVWEAVQQPYVNGGGFSRITFRDWGTGTGIDYYLNSYASRREPTISADGTVISSVEKRPDQTFASISNYYTSG